MNCVGHAAILSRYTRRHVTHPFFAAARPLVFAHRGGSALAPENTLAAFDQGLALRRRRTGARCPPVEGWPWWWSITMRRSSGPRTWRGRLADFTAEDLWRADAGYRFASNGAWPFRGLGQGIPRLEQVLSRYPDARIIIELKDNTVHLARATIEVLRRASAFDRVCLGSFGLRVLRAARALEPAVATSAAREEVRWALYRSWVRWPVTRVSYRGYQVCEIAGNTRVVSPQVHRRVASRRARQCRSGR